MLLVDLKHYQLHMRKVGCNCVLDDVCDQTLMLNHCDKRSFYTSKQLHLLSSALNYLFHDTTVVLLDIYHCMWEC